MNPVPVKSSNVSTVGYDPDNQVLHVQFRNGGEYTYPGVSAEEHEALMSAPSIGTHLHTHIKPKYQGRKL